jgi:hypothetical protein
MNCASCAVGKCRFGRASQAAGQGRRADELFDSALVGIKTQLCAFVVGAFDEYRV